MTKVLLETLQCIKKQDWIGSDECRLDIIADGALLAQHRQSMSNGQTWFIGQEAPFQTSLELKLWEEDLIGKDDLIGDVTARPVAANHQAASLTGSNANYVLTYTISTDTMSAAEEVEQAIRAFETSAQPGVWPNLPKGQVIAQLRAVVANPFIIHQQQSPLCGPASIAYELAAKNPLRYVQYCRMVYETGQFQARTRLLPSSPQLHQSEPGANMNQLDWMTLATMRESENLKLFPVTKDTVGNVLVSGCAMPWAMAGWTRELLNYDDADFQPLLADKVGALLKAQAAVDQGCVVFMVIQSAMLNNVKPSSHYPDHWISFVGNLKVDDGVTKGQGGQLHFDVFTWGSCRHLDIDHALFEECTWGLVVGKP